MPPVSVCISPGTCALVHAEPWGPVDQTDRAGPASVSPPLSLTSWCLLLMDSDASTAGNKALTDFSFLEGPTIEPQNSRPEK